MPGRRCQGTGNCLLLGVLLTSVSLATQAQVDLSPLNRILTTPTGEVTTDLVVEGIGKHPLGKIPVAIYKVADFSREIGVFAVEKEDNARDGQIILMDADAALIQGLVARGEGNSPKAEAAKARLREIGARLDSGDPGNINHLLNVTSRHFEYGLGRASMKLGLKLGFERFLKSDKVARFIRKYVLIGKEPASLIGNRSAFRPFMQKAGWKRFGARAAGVERFVDKVSAQFLDELILKKMGEEIAGAAANALSDLNDRVKFDNPPEPIMRRRLRYEVALNPTLYIPFAPTAAVPIAPMPAPARAVAAQPIMVPSAQQAILRVSDPVAQAIYLEDSYVRESYQAPETSQPGSYESPLQPPPEPEPPTAREIELHQELMCVGAGNKAGCERWNSSSEPSVQGSWDGRSDATVYD